LTVTWSPAGDSSPGEQGTRHPRLQPEAELLPISVTALTLRANGAQVIVQQAAYCASEGSTAFFDPVAANRM
jgi:hypothetical protein